MSGISLASGVRQNLYALQQSSDQIAITQNRLATGKRVNTAIDNPTNFFTSQSLNSRANDLNGLLDGVSNSLKTIEAADNGIRGITKLVENAQSIARQARALTAGGTSQTRTAAAAATTTAATGAANNGQLSLSFTPTGGTAQNIDIVIGGGKTLDQSITAINDATTNRDSQGNRIVTAGKTSDGKITFTVANGAVAVNAGTAGAAAAGASDDEIITDLGLGTSTAATKLDAAGEQRQNLAKQFNEIRDQITKLARDSGYNGINLLNGDNLTVTFNERTDSAKAELAVNGTDFTSGKDDGTTGLKLGKVDTAALNGFQANSSLDSVDSQLSDALSSLRLQASTFGSKLAIIQTRQDFTRQTINTLKSGADNLVLANNNEEAANLLTLQTRQQLSSQALALASQQEQGVLRLLG